MPAFSEECFKIEGLTHGPYEGTMRGNDPCLPRDSVVKYVDSIRDSAAWYYSFAVPNKEAAAAIAEAVGTDALLEVGSGNGYWASFLRKNGVKIIATDIAVGATGKRNEYHPSFLPRWISDMQELNGIQAINKHKSKTVFCCYPPPQKCEWLIQVLQSSYAETFVLVGETAGDTGTAALESELYKKWKLIKKVELPNFINTVYSLTIWRKIKIE